MKPNFTLVLALCLIIRGEAWSQQVEIKSYRLEIVSSRSYAPVPGATVRQLKSNRFYVSDEMGRVAFSVSENMSDSIEISAIGFGATVVDARIAKNKKIFLSEIPIKLQSVMVSDYTGNLFRPLSKIDVEKRGVNNAQELLTIVPGLMIGQHAGGGKAEQIFLRAFDIDHGTDINISVDGIPVNTVSHAHGQGYADMHYLIPEIIENIKFRKGPYDPAKGDFTTAGFVDFSTKNFLPLSSISVEAGMFNTFRTVGMFNILPESRIKKDQSLYVASELMLTDGYFDPPQNFSRVNVFSKYHGKLNDKNKLTFSASLFRSEWNASGQIPDRAYKEGMISYFGAIDPNEGGKTGRKNVNATLHSSLQNGDVITNQLFFTDYDFELYSNFTFFKVDTINGDQIRQKEKRSIVGYNGSYRRAGLIGSKKLVTDAGINVRLDNIIGSELSRVRDRTQITEPIWLGNIKQGSAGAYVNEALQITSRLNVQAGMRIDQFWFDVTNKLKNDEASHEAATIVSPKLNIYYKVGNKTQLYLTAGKGFHSNDARAGIVRGGRKFLPPAYGADIGTIVKPHSSLLLNIALWYLHSQQEFVYVGDEGIVEPGGKSRRFGFDLSARYQPVKWLYVDFDANYSRGRSINDPKGANYLPLAPVFTSIGSITYPMPSGFNASLRYRCMGDRPANEQNNLIARGYFVTDMMISYKKKKFKVELGILNLLNTKWKETQFETESRLKGEPSAITEIHFTPGTPFFVSGGFTYYFQR